MPQFVHVSPAASGCVIPLATAANHPSNAVASVHPEPITVHPAGAVAVGEPALAPELPAGAGRLIIPLAYGVPSPAETANASWPQSVPAAHSGQSVSAHSRCCAQPIDAEIGHIPAAQIQFHVSAAAGTLPFELQTTLARQSGYPPPVAAPTPPNIATPSFCRSLTRRTGRWLQRVPRSLNPRLEFAGRRENASRKWLERPRSSLCSPHDISARENGQKG